MPHMLRGHRACAWQEDGCFLVVPTKIERVLDSLSPVRFVFCAAGPGSWDLVFDGWYIPVGKRAVAVLGILIRLVIENDWVRKTSLPLYRTSSS